MSDFVDAGCLFYGRRRPEQEDKNEDDEAERDPSQDQMHEAAFGRAWTHTLDFA